MRRRFLVLSVLLSGCGGSLVDEPLVMSPAPEAAPAPEAKKPAPPPGSVFRKDVADTVDEGLGYFLQRVSVDPSIVDGKFQGFRIVELRPPEYWQGVDLRAGDVVTLVNGMPIERDIDAYQAFQTLRGAPEIRVTFLRGGSKRELVYAIVDDGHAPPKPSAAPPPPAPAPSAAPPAGKPATTGSARVTSTRA